MIENLTATQLISVKKSYLNILGLFLENETLNTRYLRCLLKWGFQLHLNPSDLEKVNLDVSTLIYTHPEERIELLESVYHLVYMIYQDKVVEDVELEVASIYADRLGFKKDTVSELFKSIATSPYDGVRQRDVRQEIIDFVQIYNP